MIYKLYVMSCTPTMIDKSASEYDICETIGEYLNQNINERFIIIRNYNDADEVYRTIRNIDDYVNYYEELQEKKLKQKGIMELKKEMFDIMEQPTSKSKKR